MSKDEKLLRFIHLFVGIGAVVGGLGAILNPYGLMGITTDLLKTGPFRTFLIPGIFLFAIIGIGNIVVGYIILKQLKYQGYISGIFGLVLVFWILIQCYILQSVAVLHVIYFVIGCLQGILSINYLLKRNQFPFSLISEQ